MQQITFLLLILLCNINLAQVDFDLKKYIENPLMFGENKEKPTTILIPYPNIDLALSRKVEESTFYSSLNGSWKFKWQINPLLVPKDFYSKNFNDSVWDNITVPSVWQMQGYDHLIYRNVPMEFYPYDPPNIPDGINPTGLYRKIISVPEDWNGREIFLHFDGIQSAAFVWLNGKYVGYHEDGMTPAEFDITDKVEKGENTLAVMVLRWCDGSYLEDQDMFRYSGIYRDAYIYSKPSVSIRNLFIKTDFDNDYKDANLILDMYLKNFSKKNSTVQIRYSLYDKVNSLIFSESTSSYNIKKEFSKTSTKKILAPQKWSDEKPYLYNLVIELLNEKEEVIEIISQRVGFRELELKNGIAMLNGIPVYIRGTNRHEHNPNNGKTLTKELMLEDIKLLKQFNFNAVRTSHYPNDPLWYDLCDEYGIFLQDEVNAECHYTENTFPQREDYLGSFMDRFERMVQRDKNHPSVIMWSTGNECGLAKPHYMMADYIKKFDPTRFLMHQSNQPDGEAPYVDIIGPRYPTPSGLRQIGLASTKPVVMGEYAHAMGNSLGHFDEFWETIYQIPKLQGGFVWDWVDQGLNVKARFVKDYSANNILCGVMGSPEKVKGLDDNAFKLSGLDDWVEVYDDSKLDLKGNNLVIEATIFPQKFYIENPIVTKAFQYGITQTSKDTLCFYINSYQNTLNIKLPQDWYSSWHKVKATYDGESMTLLIDGKNFDSKKFNGNINSSHYPVNIGRDSYKDTDQHLGWISNYIFDDVRIYNQLANDGENILPILWLKFDEIFDGNNYYTYGISPFCINGMVTADRKPQPELWQAKHSMSPVRFYSVDPLNGIFQVVNKYSFTNLNEFEIDWSLFKDCKLEQSGKLNLDVNAQSQKEFQIPIPQSFDNNYEYVVEFSCKLKKDEPFRSKGFEVNFQQFVLNEKKVVLEAKTKIKNSSKIKFKENESDYSFQCGEINYQINKITGLVNLFENNKLLISSMIPNVWRAPISNEKVDWGKAEAEDWYRMGMNESTNSAEQFKIKFPSDSLSAILSYKSYTNFSRSSDLILNEFEYTFNNDGSVKINHQMTPLGTFNVSWLPCLGLALKVPNEYQYVKWSGSGPYENYADRNTGARISIHEVQIDSVQVPYIEPQEYGNYSKVKWFELKNKQGDGLKCLADKEINFSAVPYYNLDRARYNYQLFKDDFSRVSIGYGVTGVGDTPNPVMPKYRVYPQVYSNTILIVPLKNSN